MPQLTLNPEYAEALEKITKLLGGEEQPKTRVGDIETRRTSTNRLWPTLLAQLPGTPDVERTHVADIPSYDGYEVPLFRFAKKHISTRDESAPAIVYIHGGGFFSLSVDAYSPLLSTYVSLSGVTMYAMDYRLSPEHRFPKPLEDSYACLKYVHDNASQLGVDAACIAIMGDSAGGGLCAGAAILARNRDLLLAKQIIINGVLDDRTVNPRTMPEIEPFTTWTLEDNITAWDAYLEPGHEFKAYIAAPAAPARLGNASGLAPLYLDVPALDVLRDEGVAYAGRLLKAGVEAELHVYPGVPHSFEAFAPNIKLAKMAFENRVRAMTSF